MPDFKISDNRVCAKAGKCPGMAAEKRFCPGALSYLVEVILKICIKERGESSQNVKFP